MKSIEEIAQTIRMVVFDFDGVFTDNRVLVLEDGKEAVFCSRSDGFGLSALRSLGIELLVISTEVNPVVGTRCNKLQLQCIQGCDDKAAVLKKEASLRGIPLLKTAYMGNDINDLECLSIVGLPVCVNDAYPEILNTAKYITAKPGGFGAVREFCDYLVKVKKDYALCGRNIDSCETIQPF